MTEHEFIESIQILDDDVLINGKSFPYHVAQEARNGIEIQVQEDDWVIAYIPVLFNAVGGAEFNAMFYAGKVHVPGLKATSARNLETR